VVASTMDERGEFVGEKVNSAGYTARHMGQIFEDGFSFSGFEKDKVWLKLDDQYLDVSDVSGADDEGDGRALCVADFDDDGDPDFFVHDIQRERHMLYRNDVDLGARGIKVRLRATKGPWEAFGAVVRATAGGRTTAQVLAGGSGFVSQNAPELLFGTGDAGEAEIAVRWPGRSTESFGELAAGKTYLLEEGTGKPKEIARRPTRLVDPGAPGLKIQVGDRMTSLSVLDAKTQQPVNLATADAKKPFVVNLWATYCQSCVAEMPDLQKLSTRGDVTVVTISLDDPADFGRANELLASKGATFGRYFAGEKLYELLDLERLPMPTTLVFDGEGKIVEILQTTIDHWERF
jgi:thiol-disulfide isomerase/thioredoxin